MLRLFGFGTTSSTPPPPPLILPTQQSLSSLQSQQQQPREQPADTTSVTMQEGGAAGSSQQTSQHQIQQTNLPVPPRSAQLDLAESISSGWEVLMECKIDANREEQLKQLSQELSSATSIPEESEKTLAALLIACYKIEAIRAPAEECLRKAVPKLSEKGTIAFCELFCAHFFETLQADGLRVIIESLPVLHGMSEDESQFQKTSSVIDSILAQFFRNLSATTITTVIQLIQELVSKYHAVLGRLSDLKAVQMYKDYLCSGLVLGKGSYAKVFLSFHKKTAEKYAMKVMKDRTDLNSNSVAYTKNEIDIQTELSHPNIVRLYESFKINGNLCMILEYCAGGNLATFLSKHGPLPEERVKVIMRELKNAFEYLQSKHIAHRDLKPANILLGSNPSQSGENATVKLADFTYARAMAIDVVTKTYCGSPLYMAPEILAKGPYSNKADLWSLGVIMYELLTGKVPFEMKNILRNVNLDVPEDPRISKKARELLQGLLQADPTSRISWPEFFMHSFLEEQNKKISMGSSISPMSSSLDHLKQRAELAEKKVIEYQQKRQEAEVKLAESEKKLKEIESSLRQRINELENAQLSSEGRIKDLEVLVREKAQELDNMTTNQQATEGSIKAQLEEQTQNLKKAEAELRSCNRDLEECQTELKRETKAHLAIKREYEELTQRHAELQREKDALASELTAENEKLVRKEELLKELEELRDAEQATNRKLQTELEVTNLQLAETKDQLSSLQHENEETRKLLAEANDQKKTYGKRNATLDSRIQQLEDNIASSVTSNKKLAGELDKVKSELEEKKRTMEQSMTALELQKESLQSTNKNVANMVTKLKETSKQLEDQTVLAQTNAQKVAELQAKLKTRDQTIAEMIAKHQEGLAKSKQQTSALEEDVKERNSIISLITNTKCALEARCEELSRKLSQQEASETGISKDKEQLSKQVSTLQQKLIESQTTIRSERVRVEELQQNLMTVTKDRDAAKSELLITKEQLKKVVDEVRKTSDKLGDTVKDLQATQVELSMLREQRQDADIRAQTIQCLLDSNEHEINNTKERLEDALERVQELEQTKREQSADIEAYKKRQCELQLSLDEKIKLILKLEAERNDLLVYKMLYEETPRAGNVVPFDL